MILCRSLHAETLQATASEGLAQGSYVAVRAGFEPVTLHSKFIDSTNAPPRPTRLVCRYHNHQRIVAHSDHIINSAELSSYNMIASAYFG